MTATAHLVIGPRIGHNRPPIDDISRRARLLMFISRQESVENTLIAEINALHDLARRHAGARAHERLRRAEGPTAYFPSRLAKNGRLRLEKARMEREELDQQLAAYAPQLNRLERKLARTRRSREAAGREVAALTKRLGDQH